MKRGALALVACLACGPSTTSSSPTTAPDPEVAEEAGDEQPIVVAAEADPRALFAAQTAALESQDAAAFVHDFEPEAVFIGPVGNAVYLGHEAIESALGDVIDASGAFSVTADEHHFATHESVAWSVHDVRIAPAEVEAGAPDSMRFRVSSVYRRAEGWMLAAQAWGAIVDPDQQVSLSERARPAAAIDAREDPACASAHAEVTAWLGGDGRMWGGDPAVFGIAPDDTTAVQPGPGGVRAHSLGDDVCVLFTNETVGELPHRLVTLFVGDALRLAHVVAIVPDAPPVPDSDTESEPDDAEAE